MPVIMRTSQASRAQAAESLRRMLRDMVEHGGTLLLTTIPGRGSRCFASLTTIEENGGGDIRPMLTPTWLAAKALGLRATDNGIALSTTGSDLVRLLAELATIAGTPIYCQTLSSQGGWQFPRGWDGQCLTIRQADRIAICHARDWQRTDDPLVLARVSR